MTDLTQPTTIPYDAAVTEVRDLFTRAERDLWRIAEIVARLEPKHGEGTLKKFAAEIGRKYGMVRLYKETYLAWHPIFENVNQLTFLPLTVASPLNEYPDKKRILERPKLTQKQAKDIMAQYEQAHPDPSKKPKPDPKPKPPREALERALAAIDRRRAAGEPVTRALIEEEAAVSPIIAQEAIAIRGTEAKQAEEKVVFSKSKQKQFDATLARALKKQQLEQEALFQARVSARITEHLTEYGLPQTLKDWAKAIDAVRYRKGVMKFEEYRKIMKCLHPDFVQHLNPPPEMMAAFNEAFRIFKQYELLLCNDKENPKSTPALPTLAELHARRAAYEAAQKAKREARKAAKTTAH